MDKEDYYWFRIWKMSAIFATVVVVGIVSYMMNLSFMTAQMAMKGIDPIIARCAIYGFSDAPTAMICAARNDNKAKTN